MLQDLLNSLVSASEASTKTRGPVATQRSLNFMILMCVLRSPFLCN